MVVLPSCVIFFPFVGCFVLLMMSRISSSKSKVKILGKDFLWCIIQFERCLITHYQWQSIIIIIILWLSIIHYYLFQCQTKLNLIYISWTWKDACWFVFSYLCWWIRRNSDWDRYKTEIVIRKGGRWLLKKIVKEVIIKKIEIIKAENEIVISEIVFRIVHEWPYNEIQKVPIYQFRLLVTKINPFCGWLPMWLCHKIQRKNKTLV